MDPVIELLWTKTLSPYGCLWITFLPAHSVIISDSRECCIRYFTAYTDGRTVTVGVRFSLKAKCKLSGIDRYSARQFIPERSKNASIFNRRLILHTFRDIHRHGDRRSEFALGLAHRIDSDESRKGTHEAVFQSRLSDRLTKF